MAPQQVQQLGGIGWDLFYRRMGRASSSSEVVMELSSYLDSGVLEMQDASSLDILA